MFKNLKLGQKLNLLLISIFLCTVICIGLVLSVVLERSAENVVADKALLLLQTMSAVRHYTNNQVNPELADRLETETRFLPQTVPAYSAREVFEQFRKEQKYQDFFYKEATLNPTNLRDKADAFETTIVEKFRSQPQLQELIGFRSLANTEKLFYIARPLSVSEPSCLRCHGTVSQAPESLLVSYGDKNGFNWKLNEIVGAQIISVPASQVFQNARSLQILVIGVISFFLLLAMVVINLFLNFTVKNPLKQMSQLAKQISMGDMSNEFSHTTNDEIGILASSLNRMKVSLQMAMDMLNSETQDLEDS